MCDNWSPIETAPKDGTRFLALEGDRHFDCWMACDPLDGCYWMDEADTEPDPIHWMPLPDAPGTHPGTVDGAEAKPVAWATDFFETLKDGTLSRVIVPAENVKEPSTDWTPLYTHPAPASPDAEMVEELRNCRQFVQSMRANGVNNCTPLLDRIDALLSKHGGDR